MGIANVRCALAALPLLGAAALLASCAQGPAPVDDRRPPPAVATIKPLPGAEAAPQASVYIVKRGDTLYSIALEHGQDYREVARWNRLDDPARLRVGRELRMTPPEGAAAAEPGAAQVGAARVPEEIEARPLGSSPGQAQPVPEGVRNAPQALRLPYSEQNLAALSKEPRTEVKSEASKPEPAKPAAPAPAERDPDAIEFAWPAKGRILAGFSEPSNKGLDIAGKPGDPVLAAAPGRVMYTGTGIRGYGKLIVIKHDNNFNSVYAHNREILVKEGQNVTRGQRIAELGDSDADAPKLHFEIRKSGKPVDPMRYLPPA
jgi:lipoprotein NlpD